MVKICTFGFWWTFNAGIGIPVVVTGRPWEARRQGSKNVVDRDCNDDIVVDANKCIEYTITNTNTCGTNENNRDKIRRQHIKTQSKIS